METSAPSFGPGRLCGLPGISLGESHVSLFDGFEASFDEELGENAANVRKEENVPGEVHPSVLEKEDEDRGRGTVEVTPTEHHAEQVARGGHDGKDGPDGKYGQNGVHGRDEGDTNDSEMDEDVDDTGEDADAWGEKGDLVSSTPKASCVTSLDSPDLATQVPGDSVNVSAADVSDAVLPPLPRPLPQPGTVAPSVAKAPSPKKVTFNLGKNEVRIYSPEDRGRQAPVHGPVRPLLKRKRWGINELDHKEQMGQKGSVVFMDHLEHLLSIEMAAHVTQVNFERLLVRMQETVHVLCMENTS